MKKYKELLAGYTTVLYTTSVNLGGKRRKSPTRTVFNWMKRKNGWKGKRGEKGEIVWLLQIHLCFFVIRM